MEIRVSAMSIVIFDSLKDLKVLVMNNEGEWVFPKGHLEKGESLVETACREVLEETGVVINEGQCRGQVDSFSYYFDGEQAEKRIEVFLFVISELQSVRPNIEEGFIEGKWLSPEDAFDKLTHEDAREALRKSFTHIGFSI